MTEREPRVRIIRKRSAHGGGHHGGAWKVAYADFVTTMMALFIVLWIVAQNAAVKQSLGAYFRHQGVFPPSAAAMAAASAGRGLLPGERVEAGPGVDRDDERALQQAATEVRRLFDENGAFAKMRDQIRVHVTSEGLRIEIMDHDSAPFFEVGSAAPTPPLSPLLHALEAVIVKLPNPITLEGHTDSRQYSERKNYANWELSADRANSARRLLEANGFPPERVERVVGHADRILLLPKEPLHASNRRITLLVRRQAHS